MCDFACRLEQALCDTSNLLGSYLKEQMCKTQCALPNRLRYCVYCPLTMLRFNMALWIDPFKDPSTCACQFNCSLAYIIECPVASFAQAFIAHDNTLLYDSNAEFDLECTVYIQLLLSQNNTQIFKMCRPIYLFF